MALIVYADILIILNLIVDFFLLLATSKILGVKTALPKLVFSGFLGGLFSLYIFLPQSKVAVELLVRILMSLIICFVAFGIKSLKLYLKSSALFFGITFMYAGAMTALFKIFKPEGMVINNSVVYFDISAISLIGCTVVFYFIFSAFAKIFSKSGKYAEKCEIEISADSNKITIMGVIDTGNSVRDVFGNSEIIIADKRVAQRLFGDINIENNSQIKNRYRVIPCGTVSGADMLDGFRCDWARIDYNQKEYLIDKPVLAVAKTNFTDEYSAIINPKIFQMVAGKNVSKIKTSGR
ncbi:MAG: sigma-E processing peptidase SpoIIGA [Clostridia bacterium]|nr:sigma-E processing peptidase SpoIIGA [Clostridia bacterium]